MKELTQSTEIFEITPKQSIPRMRQLAENETDEETIKKLTAQDVPTNIYFHVSCRSYNGGVPINATVVVLVNDYPHFAAFSRGLRTQYGQLPGMVLLRRQNPRHWLFQSEIGGVDMHSHAPGGGQAFAKHCRPEDAEQTYLGFLDFMAWKAKTDVEQAVQAAKKRLALAKAMRKGVAEYTAEGKKREFPEFHVPNAVNVHGYVDIFF
ncbi:hypothetical protein A1O7_00088 [Cladophialophora yegresii CBS 114405]|uniref:Uncharacterized protein n=1 Tax=Cladophialophora yegresii CBS 114405 TaxID=1182544 RepID=W9W6Z3_9EURO|nr:uncharacterized protein A1O7_00088 [Cladophialophora yegresii CBS 114405]EXJ63753.1 hypothetical protein A1O7_00088 [Cladophialophora yegresii CBS 114405]